MKAKHLLFIAVALYCQQSFAQVPSYVPTDSLKAWYPFTGNAKDASVNGNNGTVVNATLTTDRFGNPNSAYSFNGDSGYISCNKWISGINNNYTMACWINLNFQDTTSGLPLDIAIILNLQSWGEKMIYWSNWPNAKKSISFDDRSDTLASGIATNDSTLYTWQHLAIASNDTLVSFYLNGVLNLTTPRITRANWDSTYIGSYIGGDGYNPNFYGTINGKIDDIGIWARTLSLCEIKALYNTSFLSIATQPANQNVIIGSNAEFYFVTFDSSASYQWQTNSGLGWQNISNAGQYSGANNDTLTVSNTTLSNNNQIFRCIISNGTCSDTTAVAALSFIEGINENSINNSFVLYPNPSTNQLTIHTSSFHNNEAVTVSVMNVLGEIMKEEKLKWSNDISMNIKNLAAGIYFLEMKNETGRWVGRFVKE